MPFFPDMEALSPLAIGFSLVATRIVFLMITMPLFGAAVVPRRITVAATVVFSFAMYMGLSEFPLPKLDGLSIIIAAAGEASLGAAAGFSVRLVFAAVEGAGQLIGVPMGLGFAQAIDPLTRANTVVTSRFLGIIVAMIFLSMDAHIVVFRLISKSFVILPPGQVSLSPEVGITIVRRASMIFDSTVQLAAPVLLVLMGVMTALGLLARVAPKVNLFVLSFAISIGVGLIALNAALPNMMAYIRVLVSRIESITSEVIGAF